MGTKVIDKLRIQGSAAPRAVHEPRRPITTNASFPSADDTCHVIIRHHMPGSASSVSSQSHPSSAASRKLDFLQRVQQANKGLTSADFNYGNSRNNLPAIQFLLRGKPVKNDVNIIPYDMNVHQRVGHYKASAKEVYRARHRVPTDEGLYPETRDTLGMYRAVHSADGDMVSTVPSHAASSHVSSGLFYLGPALSTPQPPKKTSLLQRPKVPPPSTVSDSEDTRNNQKNGDGFALTGQQLQVPGVILDYDEDGFLDHNEYSLSRSGTFIHDIHPYTNTPVTRRKQWPRTSSRETGRLPLDTNLLKQCLNIQQSHQAVPDSVKSPREMVKLKHFTQYVKKDDNKVHVNYNNPYRNLRTKERKALSTGARYLFNSVDSYIHFNKIYPKLEGQNALTGKSAAVNNGNPSRVPKIPQVNGFSSHCTDTVLLKMMFEMNRPKSIRSTSKYSDVAVHKDLEEFLVVGTPSGSRSTSVMSKKVTDRMSRSLIGSGAGAHKEDVEGETEEEKLQRDLTLQEGKNGDEEVADRGDQSGDQQQKLNGKDSAARDDNGNGEHVIEEHTTKTQEDDVKSDSYFNQAKEDKDAKSNKDVEDTRQKECYSSSSASSVIMDNDNTLVYEKEDTDREINATNLGV